MLANMASFGDSRRKTPNTKEEKIGILMGAIYFEENHRLSEAEEIYAEEYDEEYVPNYGDDFENWPAECKDYFRDELSEYFGCLDMDLSGDEYVTASKELLEEAWGIVDRESAIKIINWLIDSGHRNYFQFMIRAKKQWGSVTESNFSVFFESLNELFCDPIMLPENVLASAWFNEQDSESLEGYVDHLNRQIEFASENVNVDIFAWDAARAVQVVRLSFLSGYLIDEECWEIVRRNYKIHEQSFKNWFQFSESFLLGRLFWSCEEDEGLTQASERLLSHKLSPWKFCQK